MEDSSISVWPFYTGSIMFKEAPILNIPELPIESARPLGGGDTCAAYEITTHHGEKYFCKTTSSYPDMLLAEAKGLTLMASVTGVKVPAVVLSGEDYLVLEYIEPTMEQPTSHMEQLGRSLAALHREKSSHYGLRFDNYCGQSRQINTQMPISVAFAEFYLEQRLYFQLDLAYYKGRAVDNLRKALDKASPRIYELLAPADEAGEGASLLHGDLWSGNVLGDYFIDPAIYYGHREADLAMTSLFGGFSHQFYRAYNDAYPLLPGHREREPIYQLYHILNHYTIFGGSYGSQAERILSRLI